MEQLLALGTVVKAAVGKGQTARLMIIGYYPQDNQDGSVYEYATVLYPFGMCFEPAVQCINSRLIIEVEKNGYMDQEADAFTKGLPELIKTTKEVILDVLKEEAEKVEAAKAAQAGEVPENKEESEFMV